jgi:hypothetical protein
MLEELGLSRFSATRGLPGHRLLAGRARPRRAPAADMTSPGKKKKKPT